MIYFVQPQGEARLARSEKQKIETPTKLGPVQWPSVLHL